MMAPGTLVVELLTPALVDLLGRRAERHGVRYLDMAPCYRTEAQVAALERRGFRWLNYADCEPAFEEDVAALCTRLAAAWGAQAAESPLARLAATVLAGGRPGRQLTVCLQAAAHHALGRTALLLARAAQLPQPVHYLPATGYWRALGMAAGLPAVSVPVWWQRWLAAREAGEATGVWLRQYMFHALRLAARRCGLLPARPRPAYPQQTLFFVHQDICHGDKLFVKNHLYEAAAESALHPRQIAHLFLEGPDRRTARYLRLLGSPAIPLLQLRYRRPAAMFAAALRWLRPAATALPAALRRDARAALSVLRCAGELLRYAEYLELFPRAERAVADYDLVFPQALAWALQRAGIPVVGVQERTAVSRNYHQFFVFDRYLVWGAADIRLLPAVTNALGEVIAVGPPRADLVTEERRQRRPLPRYAGPEQRFTVAVFDNHAAADSIADGFRCRVSWRSLAGFHDGILRLAQACPEVCFVYKGKFAAWAWPGPLQAVGARLQAQPNVRFETRLRRCPTYRLAAQADLCLMQHTSVGEEALAAGQRVVVFDNERFLRRHDHPLLRAGVVAETADELIALVRRELAAAGEPAWTAPLGELYGGRNDGGTRARVRTAVLAARRERRTA